MKYIKKFKTTAEYESYINDPENFIKPNVSLCKDTNFVYYHKYVPEPDYSKEYFTIEALEDGLTVKLSRNASEYRIDDGEWISLSVNATTPSINNGQTIQFRITNPTLTTYGIGTFTINKKCNVSGNIMSLLYGDNFEGQIDLSGKDYAFRNLFQNCITLQNAENLILPAIILANRCYNNMFAKCKLTTAPELPATTLADYCYAYMFQGCASLTKAPELPATTLAEYCYDSMFFGCTSLTEAPELLATTLANSCYNGMFYDCTSLTTAPQLPATTLANSCYAYMFQGCKLLTTAPELPATTLARTCYNGMFYNCTSLTTAPQLLAITLADYCYAYMFNGCSKLNYIKMLATDISANNCLNNWVTGVASSGTFVKNAAMSSLPRGESGIPTGWTVEEYNNNDPANGFEYVDLGLPSGTKWATCNVGASKPEESGLYFAWGNTVGYTADDVRNGNHVFDGEHDVLDGDNDPYNEHIKYNGTDGLRTLLPEDDAASVNMGGDWHMPTKEQLEELSANTTNRWTTMNGVNGTLFTSNINGNEMFVPAAGNCSYDSVYGEGTSADVWSQNCAYCLQFSSYGVSMGQYTYSRYPGFSVRGVLS